MTTPAGPVEFRARLGRGLTVAVAVLCGIALVSTVLTDPGAALRLAPALALPAVVVWALFGRPAVIVSDAGVEVRNVLRTVRLPWPSIERIDTKYALTLYTAYGSYAAWAAPAPSRVQAMGSGPQDLSHLPESSYAAGGVRPGDLLSSASGQAAAHIRRRWEDLRDAGYLDAPRLERDTPEVRWHLRPATAVLLLAVSAVLSSRYL
ncbi:PH domain-containing protein [Actinotalea sp. K2]|uniref:PH domain-containing protein n=1 Tax=Actinotalea sp. K2 TaxID=2939438 RepID=UPI002017C464|nr:PH domain-containing protein [Actinotalea sp. K2]MCL3862586.1 PH domain-containing protein [Actinotalea sp. K2]